MIGLKLLALTSFPINPHIGHKNFIDEVETEVYSQFIGCYFHISKSLTPQRVLLLLISHRQIH